MKTLFLILKEIIPMLVIAGLAVIGYAIANIFIVIDFISKDGEIYWNKIFFALVTLIIGYLIYKLAEKMWVGNK